MKNRAICGKDWIGKSATTQSTVTYLTEMNKNVMAVGGGNLNFGATHPLLGGQQLKRLIDTLCKNGSEVELIEIIHKWIEKNPLHRIQWY